MSSMIVTTDRNNYRPEPCRVCGARVRVVGWQDVSSAADAVTQWMPRRKCSDSACESNSGTLAAPSA